MSEYDEGFSAGVCLALQVLNAAGDGGGVLYEELLKCADEDKLMAHAKREGMLQLTGLEHHAARRKNR